MILDTTILVDLQRELRRGKAGAATRFLEGAASETVSIAFVTWMEFAEGYRDEQREDCERFLGSFEVLWPDQETSWQASRIARSLDGQGTPIGDHDVWIAALGLRHDRPVVTANDRHLGRVIGLSLRSY